MTLRARLRRWLSRRALLIPYARLNEYRRTPLFRLPKEPQ